MWRKIESEAHNIHLPYNTIIIKNLIQMWLTHTGAITISIRTHGDESEDRRASSYDPLLHDGEAMRLKWNRQNY